MFMILSAVAIAQLGTSAIACTVAARAQRVGYFRFGAMQVVAAIHSASAASLLDNEGSPFRDPIERVCLAAFSLTLFMLLHFAKSVAAHRSRPIHAAQFVMIATAWLALTGLLNDPASERSYQVPALAMGLTLIALFAGLNGLSTPSRSRIDQTVGRTLVGVLLVVAAGVVVGWPTLDATNINTYGAGLGAGTLLLSYIPLYLVITQNNVLMDASKKLMARNAQLESLQRRFVRSGRLATVGELSAVIAAQSRAPLRAMKTTAASLKSTKDHETSGVLLKSLDEQNNVLNRLIGDLLRYARPVHAQHEVVSLADLFDEAFEEAARRGRTLKVQRHGIDEIRCDPRLLSAVFQQLVVNAGRLMPENAELTVTASHKNLDGQAALSVDFRYDEHDFVTFGRRQEDFFGLAMIERIVAVHGGRMRTYENSETGKTHVTLILPEDTPSTVHGSNDA